MPHRIEQHGGLIDTHAHLTNEALAPRVDEVLANCRKAGVVQVISIASNADDADRCVQLAEREPMVFASAGIHPHDAGKCAAGDVERVRLLLDHPRVVAAGEMGLDYHYDFAERGVQREVFAAQLKMAGEFDLPLVIHCREAFEDCVELLEKHGFRDRRVVLHCFTGTAAEAERVAAMGWRVSFTGIVTFKNSTELQAIARDYPADQLMLETDSPFLSPVPVRHVRPNEPAHVAHVAAFLAELRGVPLAKLAAETTMNARQFFGLGTAVAG